nr:AraC family transcriptional regulator [Pseudoalteromonas sp. XMcav2-N]
MPWKAYWYFAHEVGFFGILSVLLIGIIKQPLLFNRLAQYQALSQCEAATQDKQLAQSIFASVDAQVRELGLFCQPRLSIQHIADQLSLGVKQVSWAINSVSGNNFSNYINEIRLEQIEKQLVDPAYAQTSVLDIAMNNGFNAKSTFNQAFKARTGMTPTRYRMRSTLSQQLN